MLEEALSKRNFLENVSTKRLMKEHNEVIFEIRFNNKEDLEIFLNEMERYVTHPRQNSPYDID